MGLSDFNYDEFLLPQTLIDDILKNSGIIHKEIQSIISTLKDFKSRAREELKALGVLKKFEGSSLKPANVCGIDGSYVVESLLSVDVICTTAVGIEGFPPPGNQPHKWTEPHHDFLLFCAPHSETNSSLARAIMALKEIKLATSAPHEVVLLDGSAFTPLANLSVGAKYFKDLPSTEIYEQIISDYLHFRKAIREILSGDSNDHIYAFITKYVTTKALSKRLEIALSIDDRALTTFLLEENEYIYFRPTLATGAVQIELVEGQADKFGDLVSGVCIIYYKPKRELPAIKIDVPCKLIRDKTAFSFLLESITAQFVSPGILEPYPLYLADLLAKNVKDGLRAAKDAASLSTVNSHDFDDMTIFMNYYGFRTDAGGDY
jgi:hypothetical protein